MRRIEVDGRCVAAVVREGAGPTVAFDAGLGGWSALWRLVLDELPDIAVVAWDRPGLGASDVDPEPPTAERVAGQWRATLRALGHEPPYVLVGHSLGGHHVRAFAGQWPHEVAGLVLVDVSIAAPPVGRVRSALSRLVSGVLSRGGASRSTLVLVERLPEDERDAAREVLSRPAYAGAVARERSLVGIKAAALRHPLPPVPMEVLSGSGAELASMPAWARRVLRLDSVIERIHAEHAALATARDGAVWSVVPGSTHLVPLDDPAAVATAVRRVLTRCAVSA